MLSLASDQQNKSAPLFISLVSKLNLFGIVQLLFTRELYKRLFKRNSMHCFCAEHLNKNRQACVYRSTHQDVTLAPSSNGRVI